MLYPFGYGLSYTWFDYSGLRVEKSGGGLKASVRVRNTGAVTGDEVAQLYIRRVSPSGTVHPLRRLIGFERLHDLAPGEEREASFTVNPCDLEIYLEKEGRKAVGARKIPDLRRGILPGRACFRGDGTVKARPKQNGAGRGAVFQ